MKSALGAIVSILFGFRVTHWGEVLAFFLLLAVPWWQQCHNGWAWHSL